MDGFGYYPHDVYINDPLELAQIGTVHEDSYGSPETAYGQAQHIGFLGIQLPLNIYPHQTRRGAAQGVGHGGPIVLEKKDAYSEPNLPTMDQGLPPWVFELDAYIQSSTPGFGLPQQALRSPGIVTTPPGSSQHQIDRHAQSPGPRHSRSTYSTSQPTPQTRISLAANEALVRDQSLPFAPGLSGARRSEIETNLEVTTAIMQGVQITPRPVCGVCNHEYSSMSSLRHHRKIHDPNWKEKFECPFPSCKQAFPYPKSVARHYNGKHLEPGEKAKVTHACTGCGKAFGRHDNLLRHQGGSSQASSTTNSVISDTSSARIRRRSSVRKCRPPAVPITPGRERNPRTPQPSSLRRQDFSYADAVQHGHQAALTSSVISYASSQSTFPSPPMSPYTQRTASTAPTDFDCTPIHPQLRPSGTRSSRDDGSGSFK